MYGGVGGGRGNSGETLPPTRLEPGFMVPTRWPDVVQVGYLPMGLAVYLPPAGQIGHPYSMYLAISCSATTVPFVKCCSRAIRSFAPAI